MCEDVSVYVREDVRVCVGKMVFKAKIMQL